MRKHNSQYDNLKIKLNNSFYDRFLILNHINLYHSGTSFKDLGKKCFVINKVEDNVILESLLSDLSQN